MAWRYVALIVTVVLGAGRAEGESTVTRLTSSGGRIGQAFFSPDGTRISFVSDRSGGWQVWVMGADGSDQRRVTAIESAAGWPSWTPKGDAILFYARVDGRFKLLRTDLEGKTEVILDDGFDDFRPLLSPDGRLLLFDRFGATEPKNHDLFVQDIESGVVRRLTTNAGYDSDARWSPDGRLIVFHSDRGASESYHTQIFLMNADGTAPRELTQGPAKNSYPNWSPDGSRIAYLSERDGNRNIWIMNVDGSRPRQITNSEGSVGEPTWTPDGGALVFPSDCHGGQDLVRMAVGGS